MKSEPNCTLFTDFRYSVGRSSFQLFRSTKIPRFPGHRFSNGLHLKGRFPVFKLLAFLSFLLCAIATPLPAAPREAEWQQVQQLIAPSASMADPVDPFAEPSPSQVSSERDKSIKLAELLTKIQAAAYADHAWKEGAKALALRIKHQNTAYDNIPQMIRDLEAEILAAPAEVKPIIRCLLAHYYLIYYTNNERILSQRSATTVSPGNNFETWDQTRIVQRIEQCFSEALADRKLTQSIPITDLAPFLGPSHLGDAPRPTLFDFIAHETLQFNCNRPEPALTPQNAFEIAADSPVFGSVAEFLAWNPTTADKESPVLRSLQLLQELLAFHQNDPKPTALLHCNLKRLRWGYLMAEGPQRADRFDKAIRAFIETNAKYPVSADARQDIVKILLKMNQPKAAREVALIGADSFPDHPFGKQCRDIVQNIESRKLEFYTVSNWTPAGETITVNHANVSHVWFRAYRRDWTPDMAALGDYDRPESLDFLKTKPDLSWDSNLKDDKDFKHHDTTLTIPKNLPQGYYLIVASGQQDFATKDNLLSTARVYSTDLTLIVNETTEPSVSGFVTDALTGSPQVGIEVRAWAKGEATAAKSLCKTNTDADGQFNIPDTGKERNLIIAVGKGDNRAADCLDNRSITSTKPSRSKDAEPNSSRESVIFFTDRAIYRPGQTIQFKGILSESAPAPATCRILAGRTVSAVLNAPNHREIGRVEAVTNSFGSFSGTFTAPSDCLTGRYEITAGDKGSTSFQVEEYKRPKFCVTLVPPETPPDLNTPTAIRGKAETYSGAAVNGATVKWSVTRGVRWATYWSIQYGNWPSGYANTDLGSGTLVTSADGSFVIPFTASADHSINPELDPIFCFEVAVDVTDPLGETRQVGYVLPVGYTSMMATLEADEWQEMGKPVIFKVHTTSLDQTVNLPATGTLQIYQIPEPQVCLDDGSRTFTQARQKFIDKQAPGELIKEVEVKTNDLGIGETAATLPVGSYLTAFIAKDTKGRQIRALADLQVIDPAADRMPLKIPFLTLSPQWKVQPGQPFTLLWGSGYPQARACVEWLKDGVLFKREWSAADRTQQTFTMTPDESMRGGLTVRVTQSTMNNLRSRSQAIEIPWCNKELKLRWEHLTSKLEPGARDTWTVVVTNPEGKPASAEMVATLYDASLDQIGEHYFPNIYFRSEPYDGYHPSQSSGGSSFVESSDWEGPARACWSIHPQYPYRIFNEIPNDYHPWSSYTGMDIQSRLDGNYDFAAPDTRGTGGATVTPATPTAIGFSDADSENPDVSRVTARRNLRETAFFYPHLTSNENGEVRISFTMPEALTKWKFLGFAHDKDLRSGSFEGETVTAKDLMVQPNPPRFLREGDVLDFTVKITNQSDKDQSGTACLTFSDAATQKDSNAALGITSPNQPWSIPAKQSRVLSWRLTVPVGAGMLSYKALATTGALSDGEEGWLPVIPRRVMLTESLALPIRDAGSKDFKFQKLLDSKKSPTSENRMLAVQVVSQPVWYAVMALPYLMESPHECSDQIFNRYYANALARQIAKSNPKIRRIFELWKNTPAPDSPLTKNADLKGILLDETPWLADANNSSQNDRKMGLLFDDNRLENELNLALKKLGEMQGEDGLWPWFPGGRDNEYISLYISTGFARLRACGVQTDIAPALKTLTKLDAILTEKLAAIKLAAAKKRANLSDNHLDPWIAHYLYTRSFFLKDLQVGPADKEAFDYFTDQAKRYWPRLNSRMSRAHTALALARLGDVASAKLITQSLKEHAVTDEESGMSWNDERDENGWWKAPIETQAMMIEAFLEIDHDVKTVDACRVWLLKQKQVHDWRTTKATAYAIHALLTGGSDLLGNDALLRVTLSGTPVKPEGVEPGVGYYESRIAGPSIQPEMGNIKLTKSDPGVAWASVHWQYFEDISKLTDHNNSSLKLEKALYVRKHTPQGAVLEPVTGPLKVGDELVTRLVLRNDRAMEFVHLKDQRGSGTDPVNTRSGYRSQDGFSYYEMTRDAASHFFIDTLPAGTHVFETSVRVQHAGTYQTGIAEIRCMYAPEFNAHSASVKIEVAL